jgi:DNA-binding NarL/FixJ family response regulator
MTADTLDEGNVGFERGKMAYRILIVDDHEVVRLGLRTLLERHDDIIVVDEAKSADEAVRKAHQHNPDVVIMDIRMPGKNGIEACREILADNPETQVIMLTSYAEDEMLFDAISAGAAGYVLKQGGGDDLVRAIRRVGQGDALLDPAVTQRVLARVRLATRQEQAAAFSDLTEQELRVLGLVSEGRTNKEIARALFLGEGTVRNYVSSILSKLGLTNRAEAAAYAVRHNLDDFLEELG